MPDQQPPRPTPTPKIVRFSEETGNSPFAVHAVGPRGEVLRLLPNLRRGLEYQAMRRWLDADAVVRLLHPHQIQIEQLLALWLSSRRDLGDDTRRRYERLFRKTVNFAAGATRLGDLRHWGGREWDEALEGPRQVRVLTRAALDWAVRQRLLEANPLRATGGAPVSTP